VPGYNPTERYIAKTRLASSVRINASPPHSNPVTDDVGRKVIPQQSEADVTVCGVEVDIRSP
jgi:hypothetical protein